jgi:hypothetical protein
MKTIPQRIVIYAKDIENITGRRRRTCMLFWKKSKNISTKKSDFIPSRNPVNS